MTLGWRRALATAGVLVAMLALAGCGQLGPGQLRSLPDPVVLPVGVGSPIGAVAVSPDGSRVFVTAEDGIEVLDAQASTVLGRLPINTSGLAMSPDGKWLAVDSVGATGGEVIDLTTHLVKDWLYWEEFSAFATMGITPDGRRLVTTAATGSGAQLRIFDLAERTEIGSAPLPGQPPSGSTIQFSPDGRRAYLLAGEISAAKVLAVDLETLQVSPFPLDDKADLVQISPDGSRLYVESTLKMFVLDAATGTVVDEFDTYDAWGSVGHFVISPDGRHLFGIKGVDGAVTVLDSADGSVEATGRTSAGGPEVYPSAAAVAPDGRRLYVLTREGLAVIDTSAFV
jgi:DNA-binding beta-propeller fold protein YncE